MTANDLPLPEPSAPSHRRWWIFGALGAAAVLAAFVLVWFQPQKLFIDDTVDEDLAGLVAASPGTTVADAMAKPETTDAMTKPETTDAMVEPETTDAMAAKPETTDAMVEPAGPVAISQGAFQSLDHGTTGRALVVAQPDGSFLLRIEDLDTDNGPDLYVILSPALPGGGGYEAGSVRLGKLKGNKGSQNYEIPAGTDLSTLRSVVIWCDRFSAPFGAAPVQVTA